MFSFTSGLHSLKDVFTICSYNRPCISEVLANDYRVNGAIQRLAKQALYKYVNSLYSMTWPREGFHTP